MLSNKGITVDWKNHTNACSWYGDWLIFVWIGKDFGEAPWTGWTNEGKIKNKRRETLLIWSTIRKK